MIDSLERALEVADKENTELASMIEGIELTLKSLLGAVRKFGVEVVGQCAVQPGCASGDVDDGV